MKILRFGLVALLMLGTSPVELIGVEVAQSNIPNALLEITIRQSEGGKVERGLHMLQLSCWNGQCELTTLTLNQCWSPSDRKQGFFPKIVRVSTQDGNLQVTRQGNVLVVREVGVDVGGDYVTTLRFGFEPASKTDLEVRNLTSFSGGFVKNSAILKRVITVDYVALEGDGLFQPVELDCAVMLPTLTKRK